MFSDYVWDANFGTRIDLEEYEHGLKLIFDDGVEFNISDDGVRRLRLMLQRFERSRR